MVFWRQRGMESLINRELLTAKKVGKPVKPAKSPIIITIWQNIIFISCQITHLLYKFGKI